MHDTLVQPSIRILTSLALCAAASAQGPTRVSVSTSGAQGNDNSKDPAMSPDGRVIAFESYASNLVAGDTNSTGDIFVRDLVAGTTERVSFASSGAQSNGWSGEPAISGDGRFVAFTSEASNLVAGDTAGSWDIFVRDRQANTTERVSVDSHGNQGDQGSDRPSISADGRFVAFRSYSTNLVANDTNGTGDIFVHDRATHAIERVNVSSTGAQSNLASGAPRISADGRWVVFASEGSTLVPGDVNGVADVFVHDRVLHTTEIVSVATDGVQGDMVSYEASITPDGRWVAFWSRASNFVAGDTSGTVDMFVRDRLAHTTEAVSVPVGAGTGFFVYGPPVMSADARFVAFWSDSPLLVAGDVNGRTDVFLRDRLTQTTTLLSASSAGVLGNHRSGLPSISADGRYVAFFSEASNLVPGDTNAGWDVFVHDNGTPPAPTTFCVSQPNSQGCLPAITFTGVPSATAGSGFELSATQVSNNTFGMLLYSKSGPALVPWQAGFLCLRSPLVRTPVQASHGNAPPAHDCSGVLRFDFNARIAAGHDPELLAGRQIWAQYVSRDASLPQSHTLSLSAAFTFVIGP